jgi:hypothetical protein
MMEKFDGVRVFWDGNHLYTSNSRGKINVPTDLKFPTLSLEGELW